jgi:predicted transcriptional regulator
MSQTLLEMAKDLVMAQVEAHRLSPEDMHQALQQTYASLQALKAQEDANGSVAVGSSPSLRPSAKADHTRLKCAFAYCVHFVDHTPSAGSA